MQMTIAWNLFLFQYEKKKIAHKIACVNEPDVTMYFNTKGF